MQQQIQASSRRTIQQISTINIDYQEPVIFLNPCQNHKILPVTFICLVVGLLLPIAFILLSQSYSKTQIQNAAFSSNNSSTLIQINSQPVSQNQTLPQPQLQSSLEIKSQNNALPLPQPETLPKIPSQSTGQSIPQLPTNQPPKLFNDLGCEPKLQIIYVWIGGQVPPKYQNKLKTIKYPYKLIGIEQYERYKTKYHISVDLAPVAKSDLLRVGYIIEHGGFYSDFDNEMDYCCIVEKINGTKGLILAKGSSNSFMIAQQPNSIFLQNVVANVSMRQNNTIALFMGPWIFDMYWNISQFTIIDFGKCVNHTYDFTWKDQPNKW